MERQFAELFASARKAVEYSEVEPEETVVVYAETGKNPALVEAFHAAALAADAEVVRATATTRDGPLRNPPAAAVEAMAAADVVFDLAAYPWLYTEATNAILDAGTRMLQVLSDEATVVERPPEEFIARREDAAREVLEGCSEFRVTTPEGTDVVMARGDRPVHTQGGFVDRPGDWDSFGVYLGAFAPLEDRADGHVAFNGPLYLPPQHEFIASEPVHATLEGGRITDVETDHEEARIFADWLASWDDPNSYVIAHTGFGFDHRAELRPPDPGRWESYHGGVNIAFGGNNIPQLEGETACESHLDAILLDATVEVDGETVIADGEFVEGLGF